MTWTPRRKSHYETARHSSFASGSGGIRSLPVLHHGNLNFRLRIDIMAQSPCRGRVKSARANPLLMRRATRGRETFRVTASIRVTRQSLRPREERSEGPSRTNSRDPL